MLKYSCIHKVGDKMKETMVYNTNDFQDALVIETIKDVADILEERGYDSSNQIVGYLMSGDPGYISSHKEARSKLTKFERTKILEVLVKNLLNK